MIRFRDGSRHLGRSGRFRGRAKAWPNVGWVGRDPWHPDVRRYWLCKTCNKNSEMTCLSLWQGRVWNKRMHPFRFAPSLLPPPDSGVSANIVIHSPSNNQALTKVGSCRVSEPQLEEPGITLADDEDADVSPQGIDGVVREHCKEAHVGPEQSGKEGDGQASDCW
jgi:hypothetical protein